MNRAPRFPEPLPPSIERFSRTLRVARASLAVGRALEAIALAGGGAAFAAAVAHALVPSLSVPAAATSAIALLLARGRRWPPSLEAAARALDRRFRTGEIAASALGVAHESSVGQLCLGRARATFPPRRGLVLAFPGLRPLAAPALAACLALAAFGLGPVRATLPPVANDLALIEGFAREVAGRGALEAAPLAQRARALRKDLAADPTAGGRLRTEVERIAADTRELARTLSAQEIKAGESTRPGPARAAAFRLLAFAEGKGGEETGSAGGSSDPGSPAPPLPGSEASETVARSDGFFGRDGVPLRYEGVVARYFSRGR